MSALSPGNPPADGWVGAIHATESDHSPLGAAVVIDARRVLTCAHVVLTASDERPGALWVSFPKAATRERRRVVSIDSAYEAPVRDLAVLTLDHEIPPGVDVAPLRCPKPADLVGLRWWAFGFPDRDPLGDSADGQVGAALALGWLRLDTTSRYLIRPGFSGGGLWSPDYQAVVGLIGQAHGNGDGRAITLHEANQLLPAHKLELLADWSARAAGDLALAAWGWSLAEDPEGVRHWRPRARGVSVDSERGYRFRGRARALTEITAWLDRPTPDRQVLVVTGSPGVGKSAVLGRVVTTSDQAIRSRLPAEDDAILARPGSVACAVHAKGKTALDVAIEIARAASARLPAEPGDLAPAVREVLEGSAGRRFNVVIDALDEAASPAQARAIITRIALPLAETCSDVGAQVVLGTRRNDDAGSVLDPFARAVAVIDLDAEEYFAADDLAAYARACLRLLGDERAGNPYNDEAVAEPVARRIAELAARNFLIAGLISRDHGMHDETPASPAGLSFDATIDTALDEYLDRAGPVGGLPARAALTALAFADAPGLPAELWHLAIEAIYGRGVPASDLVRFARSTAANYLVESSGERGTAELTFRLFHQALNDTLIRARARISAQHADAAALTRAFIDTGRRSGWTHVPRYLLRSLPGHAAAAGMTDELLTDDSYLLNADLPRLMLTAHDAASAQAKRSAQLIGLTPQASAATPDERAALFSVTQALEGSPITFDGAGAYVARWASAQSRGALTVMEGHQSAVCAVCPVTIDGRQLLATASSDSTVRIWDPATGQQTGVLEGHYGAVRAVCPVEVDGRPLLATASDDHTARIWDLAGGRQIAVLEGHLDWVNAVCQVNAEGHHFLVTASNDRTVRIWDLDLAFGEQIAVLRGHQSAVRALCPVIVDGHQLFASASLDQTVRIWDPIDVDLTAILAGHRGAVNALCEVTSASRHLLASASSDRTVRIWDPATGEQTAILRGHQDKLNAMCEVVLDGRHLLATACHDHTVRVWDPADGSEAAILLGHQGAVRAVCLVTAENRTLLATASSDRTVRVWERATDQQTAILEGHRSPVRAVGQITADGRRLLATASSDRTMRIWDQVTGQQLAILRGHESAVRAMCPVTAAGRQLLASASKDWTVRIWDPVAGQQIAILKGHLDWVNAVCPVTMAGREMLATGGSDETVRIWDPITGEQIAILSGHLDWVNAVCAVTVAGRQLLASASDDRTVRIWDPESGRQTAVLQGHRDWVNTVCAVTVAGRPLLATASSDQTVRIWDPESGQQTAVLEGHQNWVSDVCPVTIGDRQLLASASADQTVRLWDLHPNAIAATIPVHDAAFAVEWLGDALAIGLSAGVVVIDLRGDHI